MEELHVNVGILRMLLGAGVACGLSRQRLLAIADLTEAELINPDARVPIACQLAIGAAIIEANPGVNVALVAIQHLGVGSLGVVGYSLQHCATLGDALDTFIRYQSMITRAVVWSRVGHRVRVSAHPKISAQAHPIETMIGFWVVMGRQLTGQRWAPVAVTFRHQPLGDPAEHAAFFGVAPQFGAEHDELLLDEALLALPVLGANVAVLPAALKLLDAQRPDAGPAGIRDEVVGLLRAQLVQGGGSKEQVARALGMGERTLGRRLKAAGCSFQQLLDDTRCELAQHWLHNPALTVHEVAFLLGYSEPSTFHRAFRRWTGHTPARWRASLA